MVVSTHRERDVVLPDLESRTVETGLRLYDLIEGQTPSVFQKDYWTGKMLDWSMRDEAFKVEMFRFVDVFPYLNTRRRWRGICASIFAVPGRIFQRLCSGASSRFRPIRLRRG